MAFPRLDQPAFPIQEEEVQEEEVLPPVLTLVGSRPNQLVHFLINELVLPYLLRQKILFVTFVWLILPNQHHYHNVLNHLL